MRTRRMIRVGGGLLEKEEEDSLRRRTP